MADTKMTSRGRAAAALLLLWSTLVPVRTARANDAGAFLREDVGARGAAMGGAMAAIVDDATAVYWNPAGLSGLIKPEIDAGHVILFEDTAQDFGAGGLPTKRWGGFGAAYIRQSSGGFEQRAGPLDSPVSFSVSQNAFLAGWGGAVPLPGIRGGGWLSNPKPLALGFAVKAVGETINATSASSMGGDAGLIFRPNQRMLFGVAVQNLIQPSVGFGALRASYPRIISASPAVVWQFSQSLRGILALSGAKADLESFALSGGAELQYAGIAALRLGWQKKGPSAGVGLRWGNFQVDYAALMQDLGLSQKMSVTLRFGQTREEMEAIIRRGISQLTRGEAERLSKAYVQKAEADLREERVAEALRELEAAALWDPQNAEIPKRIASLTSRLDRSVGSQIIDRTAALAREQYGKGNLLASRQYWQSILEMDPEHKDAKTFIKKIDDELPLDQRAKLEELRRAPPQPKGRSLAAAEALLSRAGFADARQEAERVYRADPKNPRFKAFMAKLEQRLRESVDGRLAVAERLIKSGDNAAAFELLRGVLRDDPGDAKAASMKAALAPALQKGISPEARKQIDQLYYRAVDQYLKGNYEGAKPLVDQLLKLDPGNEAGRALQEKLDAAMRLSK